MTLDDLMQDPFSKQFICGLAGMLARDYQSRASKMTAEELYENSLFFPAYNPDKHDYSTKEPGYTCRTEDGIIMQLLNGQDYSVSTLNSDTEGVVQTPILWRRIWSKKPELAKPFDDSGTSPYNMGDCCIFNGQIYRSLEDNNVSSPSDYSDGWGEVET